MKVDNINKKIKVIIGQILLIKEGDRCRQHWYGQVWEQALHF